MTDLSPNAQAVLDAYGTCNSTYEAQVNTLNTGRQRLAAALRAAADQVVPEQGCPIYGLTQLENERQRVREEILSIAAELEALPND